ncbi:MAG: hypothetical protein R2797_01650 [Gelidibacter sp.]
MRNYKNSIYALACLSFTMIIGAGVFEHLVLWPKAYEAMPKSLTMFQGDYALNPGNFWMLIHPITLLLFTVNLIVFWKTSRRKTIAIVFGSYFIILVITNLYFVPELMDLTGTPMADSVDPALVARGKLWMNLSLIRICTLIILAILLYLGLTKPIDKQNT